ncbi:MAG: class I SAM-dependent methyltransferase [bacterium]|nr:class I SAM-dependent methyltransferase [bacterium]
MKLNKQIDYLKELLNLYNHPAIALWRSVEAKTLSHVLSGVQFETPVLDLGCGDGKVAPLLFHKLEVGLDIEMDAIIKANSVTGYDSLIIGDGCALPFKDGAFGLIFSNCVIEHIPNLQAILYEISRTQQLNGYLIFTVPSQHFEGNLFFSRLLFRLRLHRVSSWYGRKRTKDLSHYHVLGVNEWQEMLQAYDLNIVRTEYYMSKRALQMWDILAFLVFVFRKLRLNRLKFPKISAPIKKISTYLFSRFFRKYYEEDCKSGGGIVVVAQKYK